MNFIKKGRTCVLQYIWNEIKKSFSNRKFIVSFCWIFVVLSIPISALIIWATVYSGIIFYGTYYVWFFKGILFIATLSFAYEIAYEKTFLKNKTKGK